MFTLEVLFRASLFYLITLSPVFQLVCNGLRSLSSACQPTAGRVKKRDKDRETKTKNKRKKRGSVCVSWRAFVCLSLYLCVYQCVICMRVRDGVEEKKELCS